MLSTLSIWDVKAEEVALSNHAWIHLKNHPRYKYSVSIDILRGKCETTFTTRAEARKAKRRKECSHRSPSGKGKQGR